MVNQETIRKGSKVFFADTIDTPVTVLDNIDGQITVQLKRIIETNAEELFPVPLTPEWITRCGFIKTDEFAFEHPVEPIELDYDFRGVTHMRNRKNDTTLQLTSLHELQYVFWQVTDKELFFD